MKGRVQRDGPEDKDSSTIEGKQNKKHEDRRHRQQKRKQGPPEQPAAAQQRQRKQPKQEEMKRALWGPGLRSLSCGALREDYPPYYVIRRSDLEVEDSVLGRFNFIKVYFT